MNRILLMTFLLIRCFTSQSQPSIINDTILKTGIYKNFQEFKTNSPSIEFNYDILTKDEPYGFLGLSKVAVYRIDIEKKKAVDIGEVFGFCDGKHIYINDDDRMLNPKTNFRRIEYLGAYGYFESTFHSISNYTGQGITIMTYLDKKVIDTNTGRVSILDKSTLRTIIADDKELLNEFNNASWKNKKLKDYLIKYLKRRKVKTENSGNHFG